VRVPELAVGDLVELAAVRRLSTFLGAARDVPAVIVRLDGPPDLPPPSEDGELSTLPAVLIGVRSGSGDDDRPAAALVDLVVDDDVAADAIADLVSRRPLASTAMALLLRHGDRRTVTAGLIAESTTYSMLQGAAEFRAWREARAARAVPIADHPPVRIERDGSTTHVVLHRPGRHNAFDADTSELLVAALTDALDEADGRIVLRGEGPSFCSGGDLDEFGSFPDPSLAHTIRLSRSAGHLVHLLRERVVVRLHGACIGAGIEVPAFARRVVAAPDTRIALPELSLGLVPGAGGTVSLPRRIGRHRTMWLALTGDSIDAETALAWGLVDEITAS
jgi:hypothetical protein